MNKNLIFVDLDETLWHSTTRHYFNRMYLLPDEVLKELQSAGPARWKACSNAEKEIEDHAARILNDKGLVEGTFEYEIGMSDAMNEAFIALCTKNGWKEFWITAEEYYVSKLRPKAEDFLVSLSKLGELHVCTSSTFEYATGLLELFGIKAYFKSVISRSDLDSHLISPLTADAERWVLIDDLDAASSSMARKMFFLKGISQENLFEIDQHLVRVPEYEGDPFDDALMGAIPEVTARLNPSEGY